MSAEFYEIITSDLLFYKKLISEPLEGEQVVANLEASNLIKSLAPILEQLRPSKNVGPTYRQVLDMFIFQGPMTKSKVSPTILMTKNGLEISTTETSGITGITPDDRLVKTIYDAKSIVAKKEDIINWLLSNKKHHVYKGYINSKIKNDEYNNWLISNNIIYTDASIGNETTQSLFVQPTVRYNPLKLAEEIESEPKFEQVDPKNLPPNLRSAASAALTSLSGGSLNTNSIKNMTNGFSNKVIPDDMSEYFDDDVKNRPDNDIDKSRDNQTCK
jgi:hypothetical protein